MQLLYQIHSFSKIASSKRTWIFPWFSDSWQGKNISLHCVRMERKVLQMLSSNQPIQPDTESIYRATHCRSMLPTHNLNITAWERRKRGEVETSAVRHSGSTWFTSHQNHRGYTFKLTSSKYADLGNWKRSRNRMYSIAGEREKKYWLTRLISERAAISDPTGVMYPDILCSQTQTPHLLTTIIQTVTALPHVHAWDTMGGNLLAPHDSIWFQAQRFNSKPIIDATVFLGTFPCMI